MKSLFILLFGAFKKNMKQNIIIMMVLTLTAAMLFSAFALLQNAGSTVENVIEEHNTAHVTLWFEEDLHHYDDVVAFFNTHEDVNYASHNEMIFSGGVLDVNGNSIRTNETVIANYKTYDENVNRLRLVEGSDLSTDENGIWISTAFAYGEDIQIDDVFSFTEGGENFSFNVIGIVYDPIYSSEFMPPRLWVNDDSFNDVLLASGTLSYSVNVLLNNMEDQDIVWNDFLSSLNYNYLGYQMNYQDVLSSQSMLTNIIGASLLGFSIILLFVGAFVVYSVLKRTILQNTKVIGILKSQGFKTYQLRWQYILQFILITLISLLVSLIIGTISIRFIGTFMVRNLGINSNELNIMLGYFLSCILMMVLVIISSLVATYRIKKITPTDAIRYEGLNFGKNQRKKKNLNWLNSLSVPMQIGLKQFKQKRGQMIFSTLLAFFTAFTIFYGIAGIVSLDDSFDNMAFWGEDNRHLTLEMVDTSKRDELDSLLVNDSKVVGMSVFDEMPAAVLSDNGEYPRMLSAFVYDDFEDLQVQNVEGDSPESSDEISVSTVIADAYDLSLGDSIEIVILGFTKEVEVTGIYQTVIHMGNNIRLHKSALEDTTHEFNKILIRLDDHSNISSFIDENDDLLSSLKVSAREGSDMQGVFVMLGDILSPVMLLISFIFIGIMLIILSNFVLISIIEGKKDFGIFKSFGMTTGQVRMTVLTQFVITTLLGSILGIVVGMLTVPFILLQTMQSFGFLDFPFKNPVGLALLIPIVLLVIVSLSIWVSTRSIKQISPRELITE